MDYKTASLLASLKLPKVLENISSDESTIIDEEHLWDALDQAALAHQHLVDLMDLVEMAKYLEKVEKLSPGNSDWFRSVLHIWRQSQQVVKEKDKNEDNDDSSVTARVNSTVNDTNDRSQAAAELPTVTAALATVIEDLADAQQRFLQYQHHKRRLQALCRQAALSLKQARLSRRQYVTTELLSDRHLSERLRSIRKQLMMLDNLRQLTKQLCYCSGVDFYTVAKEGRQSSDETIRELASCYDDLLLSDGTSSDAVSAGSELVAMLHGCCLSSDGAKASLAAARPMLLSDANLLEAVRLLRERPR